MKEKLLLEGAVAGHMNHIYDNGEMTFGELKQLLQAVSDGRVRGTEKTDGQNIFLSFDVRSQKAKAIRNKTHIKAGGLNIEEFDDFFSEHPSQALRYSFVEALQTFENIIKEIDPSIQEKIFGPGQDETDIYFNTEVMNPGTPDLEDDDPRSKGTTNVIPYDKKTLLIHRVGHSMFVRETAKPAKDQNDIPIDVSENYDILEQAIAGKSSDDPRVFSVETNPIKKLKPIKNKEIVQSATSEIDNLIRDQGLRDSDTINDYVIAQIRPIIDQFGLTEDRNDMIIKRVMDMPNKPTSTQITKGLPVDLKTEVATFIREFNYSKYTRNLQLLLHDFSVAAVDGLESAFISDNSKQIKFLQDELKSTIVKINNSSNEAAKNELARQMEKLKSAKGINTPSEGFVFDWNGVTYKLTGNFAPANQILGMERFQRFGPIEPKETEINAADAETEPIVIAIIPGSFKPPHVGHLHLAEAISEGGRKVNTGTQGVVEYIPRADRIYILISAPVKNSRPFPISGKIMSAEESLQIWNAYLDKSSIKNKTEVIVSPHVSPMMPVYDYVVGKPDVNNKLIAPENATVVLGVSNKGDDWKRYKGIIEKSKESRSDLKVYDVVVPAKGHEESYNSLIEQHPTIKDQMKSNFKEFNASDMRTMIDLATKDPIAVELLKDFVPSRDEEDVFAVMGILGLNPADARQSEEDQVEEEEIDELQEYVYKYTNFLLEGFKKQKAPAAPKASGKFQKNMKRRLSRAHSIYLDMGRKDLTKHGGGFHLDRPKDISNAFLAEEEVTEISTAGSISGFPGAIGKKSNNKKRKNSKMTKKQNEKRLRMKIRESLKSFFKSKSLEHEKNIEQLLMEHTLRLKLRNVILQEVLTEQEDPTTDISDNTGINTLKDLLKNTNVLATLREVYKTLTTSEEQRKSFRAHVIRWVQDTLAPVKLNDIRPDSEQLNEQQVGVDIEGVNDEDREKFINASDGSEKENQPQEKEEEEGLSSLPGQDTTGRNKAERIYPNIEKSIVDYYGELDNPEDQEMFYDYLIANLKLYFDKWDGEMSATAPEEPTNDEYDQATTEDSPEQDLDMDAPEEQPPEEDLGAA